MAYEKIWIDRRAATIDRRQVTYRWWKGENNRRSDLGRRQAIDDRRKRTVDRRQFIDPRFGVNEKRRRKWGRRQLADDWVF